MNFDDLLSDPELATEFTLTRLAETVDAHGRAQRTATDATLTGVILPATDKQMERLPEEHRNSEVIAVYAPYQITSGGSAMSPDVVTWRGEQYEVVQVRDYMAVAGYCEALAKAASAMGRGLDSGDGA